VLSLADTKDPLGLPFPPRLFANKSRFSPETLKYLNSSCTGLMCVQIEDYNQVRDSIQAYVSGNVKIWIGASYTTYGLYEVIPKVSLPGTNPRSRPGKCQLKVEPKPLGHSASCSVNHCAVCSLLGFSGRRQKRKKEGCLSSHNCGGG
jgi:hypothetical protein